MDPGPLHLNPDPAEATAIPARRHTDPAMLQVERERIFGRTWWFAGRSSQLIRPGGLFTCAVIDEPIAATRVGTAARGHGDPDPAAHGIARMWKVSVDNDPGDCHVPLAHPGLHRAIDCRQHRAEIFGGGAAAQAWCRWIFPGAMLTICPDNLQANVIVPLGPDRAMAIFERYAPDVDRPDVARDMHASLTFGDVIQHEDIEPCEAAHARLRSRSRDTGRLPVARENGVCHIHGLLCDYLQGVRHDHTI